MLTEDQSDVVGFLSAPATYGGAKVERVETHASIVFLAGDRAYKLKRAVRYDYLDFSTAEKRRVLCERELRINRRTAPDLYLRVIPIVRRGDGTLAFGDPGAAARAVDWVLEMTRFEQEALLDRLAAAGRLHLALMRPLAEAIARLHASAEPQPAHGGRAGMAWVIDGNDQAFRDAADLFDVETAGLVTADARAALDRIGPALDRRREAGFVRQCHGDLHLRNIVLHGGAPMLFDAIEFNDQLACIDVMYDLAFLLMDLWRRRLPRHANTVLNRYLAETGDFEGLLPLPLFLSCRAGVRAKTSAAAAALQNQPDERRRLQDAAREYLAMARQLLEPPPPRLVAVGGFSGTGKSTVSAVLAPSLGAVPGAVVLRSDEIRKRLLGVDEHARLGPDGYTPEVSRRVYDTLAERAAAAVRAGHSAIADAVFARIEDRQAIEAAAASAAVAFTGIWLEAPAGTLIDRVERRVGDASDADTRTVRDQLAAGAGRICWHRIDAAGGVDDVVARVADVVGR